ncbi:hypothetical protein ACFXJ8_22790 [Nonomuraea sp. NPDC059194]|uniref:hypothetical protein n=1 Tax=Nonomuraea sp. NPDC059194 TaxID=3346764 RepID=UPI00369648CB
MPFGEGVVGVAQVVAPNPHTSPAEHQARHRTGRQVQAPGAPVMALSEAGDQA